ncbi:MAG: Uroporphyrinogen synthase [Gammaproteobacteria bacterium]|nr:Uroporphyrinogen synthase [Gammaproteobacteria bacterium]
MEGRSGPDVNRYHSVILGDTHMKSRVVAILETRTGAHLGELIARRGGVPLLAPALEEIPDVEPQTVISLLEAWRTDPYGMVIFQTGVGTRALFKVTDSLGATDEFLQFLAAAVVVVRGPKPTGELNTRQVRIDVRAPSPFTTETVLQSIAGMALGGMSVLVQRYGATNPLLRDSLETRGALVREIATYRWALPANIQPLRDLLDALTDARVDAVVFTSAVQIQNLYAVAAAHGCAAPLAGLLNGLVIGSIGPVCSRALAAHGIKPTFEANPPKLGPLVAGLEAALNARA